MSKVNLNNVGNAHDRKSQMAVAPASMGAAHRSHGEKNVSAPNMGSSMPAHKKEQPAMPMHGTRDTGKSHEADIAMGEGKTSGYGSQMSAPSPAGKTNKASEVQAARNAHARRMNNGADPEGCC